MTSALSGCRVVELGSMIAAPYCGKLFGDLGAEVVKVEPPAGDAARLEGPFLEDRPDPETSALFLYLNTSKRGIVLDLENSEDKATLHELVRGAVPARDVARLGDHAAAEVDGDIEGDQSVAVEAQVEGVDRCTGGHETE